MSTRRNIPPIAEWNEEKGAYSIPLTKGKYALVSASDYHLVRAITMHYAKGYAQYNIHVGTKNKTVFLHTIILGKKPGYVIDHANGDGLDNRRENLRFCSHSQNMHNMKPRLAIGTKGVYKKGRWWIAQIQYQGVRKYIGLYKEKSDAIKAYDIEAKKLHGDFARTNNA